MDYAKLASDTILAVGKDNLIVAAHYATRLRPVLKDNTRVDQKALDENPNVKGISKIDGQCQAIVSAGDVSFIYDELIKETGLSELSTDSLKQIIDKSKEFNPTMALIKLLSEVFVPIVPILVVGGLLITLRNFLTAVGPFGLKPIEEVCPVIKGISSMIQLMSAAPFIFLPILAGISAAKHFRVNQLLGVVIGMVITTPDFGGATGYWNIFGYHVARTNYAYQAIPVLASAYLLSILEKCFRKKFPSSIDFIFTPLLSVIITGFLTSTVIGPAMLLLSNGITDAIVRLHNATGFIEMGVFGGIYSPIIITGFHQPFPAIETQLLSAWTNSIGYGDFIFVVASMASVARDVAAFAIRFLAKNSKTKSLTSSVGLSVLLSITEPALFGTNLRCRFPFFCALIGLDIAAAIAGLLKVVAISLGSVGLLGFLSINAISTLFYLLCELISLSVIFAIIYFYGRARSSSIFATKAIAKQTSVDASEININQIVNTDESTVVETIVSPLAGEVTTLGSVNDPVSSSESIGKRIVIKPNGNTIYSPVGGIVQAVLETGHAYDLRSNTGAGILIYVDIDTVPLNDKGFTKKVGARQKVKKGGVPGTFDGTVTTSSGPDDTAVVTATNPKDYSEAIPITKNIATEGVALLTIK